MSYKPMVSSNKPIKPSIVDRMHRKAQDAVSKPRPMKQSQIAKLDKGLKNY